MTARSSSNQQIWPVTDRACRWVKSHMKEFAKRVFVAGVVIGAIVLMAYVLDWVLLILAGVLLAVLFRTAAAWLTEHTNLSFRWSITIVLIAAGVVLLGTAWIFGSKMLAEADQLMSKLSDALASLQQRTQNYPNLHRIVSQSNLNLEKPTENLLSATIWTAAAIILVLFIGAYTAVSPGMYIEGFLRLFPEARRKQVRTVLNETGFALRWWLFGQLIAMAVVGVITVIGLFIIGVPMAFSLAFLAALLTFVPYVGAIVSAIPALLIGFTVSPQTGLYVAVVFLVAHVAEGYIVVPAIQHRFVYVPPGLILANQFLMELLAGVTGIALATPFLVVIMVLVQRLYFHESWHGRQEAA